MSIKRAYYYLFYKFYKLGELAEPPFLSDWKAGIAVIALDFWLIAAILNYYNIFIDPYLKITKAHFIVLGLVVAFFNFLIFQYGDVWKKYVKEFDRLPAKKNQRGSWIVLGVVLFVLGNLILSFYLRFQVDWSKYK